MSAATILSNLYSSGAQAQAVNPWRPMGDKSLYDLLYANVGRAEQFPAQMQSSLASQMGEAEQRQRVFQEEKNRQQAEKQSKRASMIGLAQIGGQVALENSDKIGTSLSGLFGDSAATTLAEATPSGLAGGGSTAASTAALGTKSAGAVTSMGAGSAPTMGAGVGAAGGTTVLGAVSGPLAGIGVGVLASQLAGGEGVKARAVGGAAGALAGAGAGASAGASGGPYAVAVGAIVGGIAGIFGQEIGDLK
ncbi:MAG: hypothetical protein ABIL06_13310 [Pseudomonadota bacterium]|uniref:Uncharacterized protein n=1 Tax=viral metagenome TaxID=1070528 RepID=A0A6H1ZG47_9ZZZZ